MKTVKFNKKEMNTIDKVLELWELEPENNCLRHYVLGPLENMLRDCEKVNKYDYPSYQKEEMISEIRLDMKYLVKDLKSSSCRKRIYNRRLIALANLLESKLEQAR